MAIKCPKCRYENPDDTLFCGKCTTSLKSLEEISVTKTLETPATGLKAGTNFASRYEVIGELGKGGMGRVYKVLDNEINEEVALKILKPEVASDETTVERFRNELKFARKIAHKNVCKVYHFAREEETPYITMEYVPGEDLKSLVRRKGKLSEEEAISIARQVCKGLAEAHELGVVHRDLKPQNIMIDERGRVKIMDFGIARFFEASGVTVTGVMIGTPDYISPEQTEGEEVDQRSDIYSLGVILYDMVTGDVPFKGNSALSVALKHKSELPPDPKKLNPQVSENLSRLILICMEKDKEKRYQTAGELDADLRNIEEGHPLGTKIRLKQKTFVAALIHKKLLIPVLLVLLTIFAGSLMFLFHFPRWGAVPEPIKIATERPVPPETLRRSVAVLGFKNLAMKEETNWVSTAVAELLGTQLGAGKELRILSGEAVTQAKIELGLPETDSLTTATLEKVRLNLGADIVVIGSYVALGPEGSDKVSLSVRAQDTVSGEMLGLVAEEGELAEIFTLVGKIASKLTSELGVGEATVQADAATRASLPADPDAARLYAEGIDRLRRFDALAARDILQSAVYAAPDHPMAHLALSEAWGRLGYDSKARETAEAAFEHVSGLGIMMRLRVEARLRELEGAWEQAAGLYRTLWVEEPDEIEYALKLAKIEIKEGKTEAALTTVAALRQLPKPISDDPRIDLVEASAAHLAADYERQLKAAARAAAKGEERQAPLIMAAAKLQEANAWWRKGSYETAMEAAEAARALWEKAGDSGGAANALIVVGNLWRNIGDLAKAYECYNQSLAIQREVGDRNGEASALHNLALLKFDQGNPSEALEHYNETLKVFQEIRNRRREAAVLLNIANVLIQQGNFSGALERYEKSLSIRRETGDKYGEGLALNNIGAVLYFIGDFEGALQRYKASLAIREEIGDRRGVAECLGNIGGVLLKQGDTSRAKEYHEKALTLSREIRDRPGECLALLNLGELSLILAEPGKGMELQNEALEISREIGLKYYESCTLLQISEILLATDRITEAEVRNQESQNLQEEIGASSALLYSRLKCVALSKEAGRFIEALAEARELSETYRRNKEKDGEAEAEALRAQILLALEKDTEAVAAAERAALLASERKDLILRFRVEVAALRVQGLAGSSHTVRERLIEIADEAEKKRIMTLVLETWLALGEVEIAAEETAGRNRLKKLEKEAERRGMKLIARKARELIAP